MKINRPLAIAAAVVAVALAAVLTRPIWGPDRIPEQSAPDRQVVDTSVPGHVLLDDVLAVVEARRAGQLNFSYLPREKPAELIRLTAGSADPLVDGYQFGPAATNAFVQFTRTPSDLCADLTASTGGGLCVREGQTGDPEPTSGLQNFTTYLTARSGGRPDEKAAHTKADKAFWAEVEMVPLREAAWFAELVTRAQNAPKV